MKTNINFFDIIFRPAYVASVDMSLLFFYRPNKAFELNPKWVQRQRPEWIIEEGLEPVKLTLKERLQNAGRH